MDSLSPLQSRERAMQRWQARLSQLHAHSPLSAWIEIAELAQTLGQPEQALWAIETALELHPNAPVLHHVLGDLQLKQYQHSSAFRHYHQALLKGASLLHPLTRMLYISYMQGNLGALLSMCQDILKAKDFLWERALSPQDRLQLQRAKTNFEAWLLLSLYSSEHVSETDFYTQLHQRIHPPQPGKKPSMKSPLKVAYLSREFKDSPSAQVFESLLAHHDQDKFEVHLLADQPLSEISPRFKTYAHTLWPVHDLNNTQLSQHIQTMSPDILMDLGGLRILRPGRLELFQHRLAPLQLTGLGLLGIPTGLSDGFFADDILHSSFFQGKQLSLNTGMHWLPPPFETQRRLPGSNALIFGSANTHNKLTDKTVRLWSEVIRQVPQSSLLLKTPFLEDVSHQHQIMKRFEAAGLPSEKLYFQGQSARKTHMEDFYGQIDIALDSTPYEGCITTCEALWMGVPVLTLGTGRRMGVSILKALGLQEWVADSEAEYIEKAIYWAGQRKQRESLRWSLRDRLQGSPVCDGLRFAQEVESCLEQLIDRGSKG